MSPLRAAAGALALSLLAASCGGGGKSPAATKIVQADSVDSISPETPAPPTAQPPSSTPPPIDGSAGIVWGANGHPLNAYPDIPRDQQIKLVSQLGGGIYRVNLRSDSSIEELDALLKVAEAQRMIILPIINPPVDLDNSDPAAIYRTAYDTAKAFSSAFPGRVPVWELGNEQENYAIILPCEMRDNGQQYGCQYGPGIGNDVLDYYGPRWSKMSALIKGMSDGVHAGNPEAKRAIGVAGWGHTAFFDRIRSDGVDWDISVWHQYAFDNAGQLEYVARFGKPIWIAEFNNPAGGQNGVDDQAKGLTQMIDWFQQNRARFNIQAALVYELLDEPYYSGFESTMGLVRQKKNSTTGQWEIDGVKLGYQAMAQAIKQP